MYCGPPSSSVHGILQARILEWIAIPFSRGSSLWESLMGNPRGKATDPLIHSTGSMTLLLQPGGRRTCMPPLDTRTDSPVTAYEMCVGDWSSDVCSSDLGSRGLSDSALLIRDRNHFTVVHWFLSFLLYLNHLIHQNIQSSSPYMLWSCVLSFLVSTRIGNHLLKLF